MMRYPVHPSQPNSGNLPSMKAMGPHDLHPSAHNPYYDVYNMSRGRYLGSIGQTEGRPAAPPPSADAGNPEYQSSLERGMKDYPNELDSLSDLDDVNGNGIFDAPGTHGNVHPDSGVFADRKSLPGYIDRERMFQPSEVLDVTTGEPVMYVPGNAFQMDPRTQWVMDEIALYEPGLPSTGGRGVPSRSTVQPRQPAWPVGQDETRESPAVKTAHMAVLAAIAGLSGGLLIGIISK